MLPKKFRLSHTADFRAVVKNGKKAGSQTVVTYVLRSPAETLDEPTIGFVVSKAVGNSVVRHTVSRKLRAQMYPLITSTDASGIIIPAGAKVVVRALPQSASASSEQLRNDLVHTLQKVLA